MRIIEALQLFFAKGESIGRSSLTTPIAAPPKTAEANITVPNAFLAKARNASSSSGADNYMDLADNCSSLAIGVDLAMDIYESTHYLAELSPLL